MNRVYLCELVDPVEVAWVNFLSAGVKLEMSASSKYFLSTLAATHVVSSSVEVAVALYFTVIWIEQNRGQGRGSGYDTSGSAMESPFFRRVFVCYESFLDEGRSVR